MESSGACATFWHTRRDPSGDRNRTPIARGRVVDAVIYMASHAVVVAAIQRALGAAMYVPLQTSAAPERVLWCNFALARQLGFRVPRRNRLSRRLERQLVDAFSLRALQPGDAAGRHRVVTLHTDRYSARAWATIWAHRWAEFTNGREVAETTRARAFG